MVRYLVDHLTYPSGFLSCYIDGIKHAEMMSSYSS